jgi:splicing factor U2AF subunit
MISNHSVPFYPVIFISYLTYVCFWGGAGNLINLVIPRPNPTGEEVPGIGMVFVEYEDLQGAAKAKASLHGRKFDRKTVIATYYPEEKFIHGDYGG